MATTVRFREHDSFHRAALHMAIAGALAGLGAHVAGLLFPGFGPITAPWALAGILTAAAYGAAPPDTRTRLTDLALLAIVFLGVGAILAVSGASDRKATLGAAAFGLAFGALAARGAKGRRFVLTLMAGAGAALVGRFVYESLVSSGTMARLPMWLVAGLGGAAFAFVAVLGLVPRHLEIGTNRIQAAYDACAAGGGEIRELADRGMAVWTKVESSVEEGSPVRKAIEDSLMRLFEVARRWQAVEADGGRVSADALVERMDQIEKKIAATTDDIARKQYQNAQAALGEQLRYLKEIGTARERVVARMHHYIAAMERLRFAVINHRSADASRVSDDVQPILADLEDLGKEIDFASEALVEVERQEASGRPTAQA